MKYIDALHSCRRVPIEFFCQLINLIKLLTLFSGILASTLSRPNPVYPSRFTRWSTIPVSTSLSYLPSIPTLNHEGGSASEIRTPEGARSGVSRRVRKTCLKNPKRGVRVSRIFDPSPLAVHVSRICPCFYHDCPLPKASREFVGLNRKSNTCRGSVRPQSQTTPKVDLHQPVAFVRASNGCTHSTRLLLNAYTSSLPLPSVSYFVFFVIRVIQCVETVVLLC